MKTTVIGHVESLWRYPVKSMRGEALPEAFVSFPEFWVIGSMPSTTRLLQKPSRI